MRTRRSTEAAVTGVAGVGDVGYALGLMASSYKTILEAFKELVTNAVESRAEHVTITIQRGGRNPYIVIGDDGHGMSKKFLAGLPGKIFYSVKRRLEEGGPLEDGEDDLSFVKGEYSGRHGVGLPTAALRLGADKVRVDSTTRKQGAVYSLFLGLVGREPPFSVKEAKRSSFPTKSGTRVYLFGLDKKAFATIGRAVAIRRREGTSRLAEYLSFAFAPQLSEGVSISIEVFAGRGGKRTEMVPRISYQGVPVPIGPIRTRYGPIEFQLFIGPPGSKSPGVALHHVTTPLVMDVATLEEFGSIWRKGVQGSIGAPWLERTGDSVKRYGRRWKAFLMAIRDRVEPVLEAAYRKVEQESLTGDEVKRLREALKQALRAVEDSFKLPQALAASADGPRTEARRADLGGERGPTGGEGKEEVPQRLPYAIPTGKASPLREPRPMPPRAGIRTTHVEGIVWELGPFKPELSGFYYYVEEGVIFVNTGHPDYLSYINAPEPLSRRTRKLLWMAQITCLVLLDINYPVEEYSEEERLMQFGRWYGQVSALVS